MQDKQHIKLNQRESHKLGLNLPLDNYFKH